MVRSSHFVGALVEGFEVWLVGVGGSTILGAEWMREDLAGVLGRALRRMGMGRVGVGWWPWNSGWPKNH